MCFDRHVATEEKTHTHTQPLTVVILDVRHYASFHSVLPEKILCSGKEAKKKQPLSLSLALSSSSSFCALASIDSESGPTS